MAALHTLPRLYTETPLKNGAEIVLSLDQTHYLIHVMRTQESAEIRLFNGSDGEWLSLLKTKPKKKHPVTLLAQKQIREQSAPPDLMLCAALIKRAHFDFMVMKATELGVSSIQPIITERTQIKDCKLERLKSIAIEAAEQSERLTVPEIKTALKLPKLLVNWPKDRSALLCAEFGQAKPIKSALQNYESHQTALIVGPEGGFTEKEMDSFNELPHCIPIRLGPRILRADTAAIAALSCWQALCGDWMEE